MGRLKKLFQVLTAVLTAISLCFAVTASAAGAGDYRENDGLHDKNEFAEICGGDTNMDTANCTAAYKVHYMDDRSFYSALIGGRILEEVPEEYVWIMSAPGGGEAVFSVSDGGIWENTGYRGPVTDGVAVDDTVDMDAVGSAAEDISGGQADIADIPAVCVSAFHTNFVLLSWEGKEYAVPFGARPDLTGLTNGEVYTADELTDILEMTYAGLIDDCVNGEGSGGEKGGRTRDSRPGGFTLVLICAGGIAILYAVYRIAKDITKHKSK